MSAEYIVEYTGGVFWKWRLSPKHTPDRHYRHLDKALAAMCKKLHISAPAIRLNERTLLEKFDEVRVYYDSERKPTRFGAAEDINDMSNSIYPEHINHYENGAWLIQVCPRGKTFWSSGKSYNHSTLDDALSALEKRCNKEEQ